jgi:hypothetical protein
MLVKGVIRNKSIQLTETIGLKEGTVVFVEIKRTEETIDIREWTITEYDAVDLTPVKVRNLMIRCFTYAHLEEALEKKQKRLTYDDYDTAKETLIGEIKVTFRQVGEDFENPTKKGLSKVLHTLAEKQINRGATISIIESHRSQLYSVISQLQ